MPGLLDLFLPVSCGGCGMPAEPDASAAEALVCPGCRAALRGPCLGRLLGPAGGELLAVAGAPYEGPARRLVIEYKERGRQGLARPLGQLLTRAVHEVLDAALPPGPPAAAAPVVLIPVPSRAAARRARGFDHVAVLARAAAVGLRGGTRGPTGCAVRPLLAASVAQRDQAGLDAALPGRPTSTARGGSEGPFRRGRWCSSTTSSPPVRPRSSWRGCWTKPGRSCSPWRRSRGWPRQVPPVPGLVRRQG